MGALAEIKHLPDLLQDYILEQREKKENKDVVKDINIDTIIYSQEAVESLKTPENTLKTHDMSCEDEEFDLEELFGSYDV